MAQIFVSHSKADRSIVDFLSRVAAGTSVKFIFEEFERMVSGEVNGAKIHADIQASNAVFVVVTKNLLQLPHTRDWVLWESGVAANKDIWVLEPCSEHGVTIVTPVLRQYVVFDPTDEWFPYFRQIIQSYDDSHVLPTMLAAGGIGAGLGKGPGALVGAGLGLFIATMNNNRPSGLAIGCGNCRSTYGVHLPVGRLVFRCPVCNSSLKLISPASVTGMLPSAAG